MNVRLLDGGCVRVIDTDGRHLGDFAPDNLQGVPEAARAAAEALWTDEVVAAWQATQPAVPTPTLADLKAARRAELEAVRYRVEIADIAVGDIVVDMRRDARRTLSEILLAFNAGAIEETIFKGADGAFTTVDQQAFTALWAAAAGHVKACFEREAELAALIDAAEDAGALAAIDLTTGWPGGA